MKFYRLSRNAGDLGSLVDLMDQKLLTEIRTYGQKFTNSPNEKFMLMLLCSTAKLENDNKSVNVKRGLRMRCEMGLWPAPAPTGYLNQKRIDKKCEVIIDPQRAPVIKQMFEKVAYEKWSGRKIYHWLKFDLNFQSSTSNKPLTLSNIYRLLQTPFYYGVFEYPAKSGNWYTGKHESIITRELFEKTRDQLKRSEITRDNKEFAFTKLIICGLCGSGITANEKIKKQKNGNIHTYIYYGCTRSKDLHCKAGYISEDILIEQLNKLIEKLDLDELGIKTKLKKEMERFNKFSKIVYGEIKNNKEQEDFNLKQYAKYILKERTIYEKRDLLADLKTRLIFKERKISLE